MVSGVHSRLNWPVENVVEFFLVYVFHCQFSTDFKTKLFSTHGKTQWSLNSISELCHGPAFCLLNSFAMPRSPSAFPLKILAARLLIANSNHKKKAKKQSAGRTKAAAKSTEKENESPAAVGRKTRSIVVA